MLERECLFLGHATVFTLVVRHSAAHVDERLEHAFVRAADRAGYVVQRGDRDCCNRRIFSAKSAASMTVIFGLLCGNNPLGGARYIRSPLVHQRFSQRIEFGTDASL